MTAVCSPVDMVTHQLIPLSCGWDLFPISLSMWKEKKLCELDFPWETRIILVPVFPLTDPYVLWIKFS